MNLIRTPFTVNGHEFTGGTLTYKEVIDWPIFERGVLTPWQPTVLYYEFELEIWKGPVDKLVDNFNMHEWVFEYKSPTGQIETLTIHTDIREWDVLEERFWASGRLVGGPMFATPSMIRQIKPRVIRQIAGYLWRDNGKAKFRPVGPCVRSEEARHSW